jgi:aspartate racemase
MENNLFNQPDSEIPDVIRKDVEAGTKRGWETFLKRRASLRREKEDNAPENRHPRRTQPRVNGAYYQYITREYARRFGNHAYPEIIIYSVCFQKYVDWWTENRWDAITENLVTAARSLEQAGADFGIIATNTMHIVFDEVQKAVKMPFLNLIDATAESVKAKGLLQVGLLGTKFTMSRPFYKKRLAAHGIKTLVPSEPEHDEAHRIIIEELVGGRLLDSSRKRFLK